MPIAAQVDEPEVWIVKGEERLGGKGVEGAEPVLLGPLLIAGERARMEDELFAAVAVDVGEPRASVLGLREHGPLPEQARGQEGALTHVALVRERAFVLAQDPREPVAVEVEPLIGGALDTAGGRPARALGVHGVDLAVQDGH
ncbi:MAG: hypothetical protein U0359_33515 [Byssovorax sp.]